MAALFVFFRTNRFFFCFVNFILFLSLDLVLVSTLFSLGNVLVSVGAVSTTTLDGQIDGWMVCATNVQVMLWLVVFQSSVEIPMGHI